MQTSRLTFALSLALLSAASNLFASNDPEWKIASSPLTTKWAAQVSPKNALVEYPRPQMTRKAWMNLNGLWDYGFTNVDAQQPPRKFDGKILVPYPMEAALSGLSKKSETHKRLWYHRSFQTPASWKEQNTLLHFGAVNWDSQILINGQLAATHRGGYDGFDVDISQFLKRGDNDIAVSAWNPLLADDPADQVLGKQRVHPESIFYTAATGIWQTVWLEPVPASHIDSIKLTPNVDAGTLKVEVQGVTDPAEMIHVVASDGRKRIYSDVVSVGQISTVQIPNARLWSPEDPHLYNLQVTLMKDSKAVDSIGSYFAMRKISLGKDDKGRTVLCLNNKPSLQIGTLDQGYWPDGIYTAPTDEALKYDIEVTKSFGFNLIRKHAKVEPDRWYYWTDKLGMLVWQDMPQGFTPRSGPSEEGKKQFIIEWAREIATHYNHPSIVVWTTFNEGWGQHDTPEIVALTKKLDPTRLVNNASGWNDMHVGDIADKHDYPGPGSGDPEPTRAAVNGEFGGVTMRIPGHMWTENVMGYGKTLTSSWDATKRYQDLLRAAYALHDSKGTSAFVYTQITDVEQESNGLLTYDRKVIKLDFKIVTAANKSQFMPMLSHPSSSEKPKN